jgi:preprotein translocase subunit SecF
VRNSWNRFAPAWGAALAVIMSLMSVLPAAADEIYKSVDAQGHVVYSDRAPSANAQKSEVRVVQPDAAEAAREAKQQQLLNAQDVQRKQQDAIDSRNKAQQDKVKQQRCQAARTRYNSIKDAGRLYRLDSDGNRVFYTDEEADARREEARQAMVSACGQ